MYKRASKLKLRVKTQVGLLPVESLWDLTLKQLADAARNCSKELKKLTTGDEDDLGFLENNTQDTKEVEEARLRFNIVKDIYQTKQEDIKNARDNAATDEEIRRIETLLAKKKDQELENMSSEDLEKKLAELRGQKK